MVGRISVRMIAKHIARELVEQDHARKRRQRIRKKRIDGELTLLEPELQEAELNPVVELGIGLPPLLRFKTKPEFEDIRTPVLVHAIASSRDSKRSRSGISMPKSLSSTAQTSCGFSRRRFSVWPPTTWIE